MQAESNLFGIQLHSGRSYFSQLKKAKLVANGTSFAQEFSLLGVEFLVVECVASSLSGRVLWFTRSVSKDVQSRENSCAATRRAAMILR